MLLLVENVSLTSAAFEGGHRWEKDVSSKRRFFPKGLLFGKGCFLKGDDSSKRMLAEEQRLVKKGRFVRTMKICDWCS